MKMKLVNQKSQSVTIVESQVEFETDQFGNELLLVKSYYDEDNELIDTVMYDVDGIRLVVDEYEDVLEFIDSIER